MILSASSECSQVKHHTHTHARAVWTDENTRRLTVEKRLSPAKQLFSAAAPELSGRADCRTAQQGSECVCVSACVCECLSAAGVLLCKGENPLILNQADVPALHSLSSRPLRPRPPSCRTLDPKINIAAFPFLCFLECFWNQSFKAVKTAQETFVFIDSYLRVALQLHSGFNWLQSLVFYLFCLVCLIRRSECFQKLFSSPNTMCSIEFFLLWVIKHMLSADKDHLIKGCGFQTMISFIKRKQQSKANWL